jgi:hypothetical protein
MKTGYSFSSSAMTRPATKRGQVYVLHYETRLRLPGRHQLATIAGCGFTAPCGGP